VSAIKVLTAFYKIQTQNKNSGQVFQEHVTILLLCSTTGFLIKHFRKLSFLLRRKIVYQAGENLNQSE